MKIIQLIQKPQPRGAETFAAQLSRNLSEQGIKSDLVAIFDSADAHKYKNAYQLLGANAQSRLWDKQGWEKLAILIKEQNPDIVQANAGDTLKYAVFSKLLFKWKQPIVFRNASTLSSYIRNPLQKLYNGFLYKQTDAIVSVSNHSRLDLIELYPLLERKTCTIPIGLEGKAADENPFTTQPDNQVNLVHVGGFTFEKNHEGLIRIFKSVLERNPNSVLWLIGDGPRRSIIEKIIEENNLESKVRLTGFIHNPLDYIAHANVLMLPSIIEGLPGVLLEAMLYETPVVAYNVGGIKEIVTNKQTGWLITSGDEAGFANAVGEVLMLEDTAKQVIIERARKQVEAEFMNRQIAEKFTQLYAKVLKQK